MCKNDKYHLSVRIPVELLEKVDEWCKANGGVSRSMAVVYLLAQQLLSEERK